MPSSAHTIGLVSDFHSDPDPHPTRAELARDDAAPPEPVARRNGHTAVTRYVEPPERRVHLAFDGTTTMCGAPYEFRVVRCSHPTCPECVQAVDHG
jgi:hypothetical protein